MATTVTVIGQSPKKTAKKIELVHHVSVHTANPGLVDTPLLSPSKYDHVELIYAAGSASYLDVIFCYNNDRKAGGLYLVYWNDGEV